MKKLLVACFLSFLFLFQFVACNKTSSWANAETIGARISNGDGTSSPELTLELALTNQQRQVGLMYRKSMPETTGMLFVFPNNAKRSFWMKNTYLALDMIFINDNLIVDSIVHNATPLTTTQRVSKGPAKYVVEVRGGLAGKWGIVPGSRLNTDKLIPSFR